MQSDKISYPRGGALGGLAYVILAWEPFNVPVRNPANGTPRPLTTTGNVAVINLCPFPSSLCLSKWSGIQDILSKPKGVLKARNAIYTAKLLRRVLPGVEAGARRERRQAGSRERQKRYRECSTSKWWTHPMRSHLLGKRCLG